MTAQPPLEPEMPALLAAWSSVTTVQLTTPRAEDWPSFRRTYNGWGHSPLTQIDTTNVKRLKVKWSFATGEVEGHQAPPLVVNGVMFVSTPGAQVIALDAANGRLLWRYRRPLGKPHLARLQNRGVAVFGDKVYFATADAVLVALDVRTGTEAWAKQVADVAAGYYMTMAPLVAGGKVMIGASGGSMGIRGFVAAFDPDTGGEAWRTYMVPAPGEPGSETWPKGDQWRHGGASIWVTGTYNPATNVAYWGTGNGGPWIGDQRPGDNLYTSSVVALDVASGAIQGHFQYHQNDSWDWDEVSPPLLVPFKANGRARDGLITAARDGYLWWLEQTPAKIGFVKATRIVRQNVFKSVDPVTGRPDIDIERKPGTGRVVEFCPGLWGGKNWPSVAFDPATRLLYIPANNNLCHVMGGAPNPVFVPGQPYMFVKDYGVSLFADADHIGEVQAWNVDTGRRVWTTKMPGMSPNWGPLLSTAGHLVFGGGTNDQMFRAFDARTGKVLWQQLLPSGVTGAATSYAIKGTQFIAVQAGWGGGAAAMQEALQKLAPGRFPEVPQGGSIWAFALK